MKHNWLVNKIVEDALKDAVKTYAKNKLIDIGCGDKPYKGILESYVIEHVGLEHHSTLKDKSQIDLFGTAYAIPVEDESFDTVLCTSVLEHLEEPSSAIKEANRVLKRGSYAILTVPLFWHLHEEPRDFYRFTRYGIKYLLETNGFEVTELVPLSGFLVTFGQELVYYLYRFKGRSKFNPVTWLVLGTCTAIQRLCYSLNSVDRSEEFTWMYIVVAKKIA
jgi:SAM-dependent methyltransferase